MKVVSPFERLLGCDYLQSADWYQTTRGNKPEDSNARSRRLRTSDASVTNYLPRFTRTGLRLCWYQRVVRIDWQLHKPLAAQMAALTSQH